MKKITKIKIGFLAFLFTWIAFQQQSVVIGQETLKNYQVFACVYNVNREITPTAVPTITPTIKVQEMTPHEQGDTNVLVGTASHYNRAGCLGCDPNFIMANGEPLNDNALTLALTPGTVRQHGLMNQFVKITNMINGKSVQAKVTDTGGFAKYDRIADLSDGTKNAIECSSLCEVRITF